MFKALLLHGGILRGYCMKKAQFFNEARRSLDLLRINRSLWAYTRRIYLFTVCSTTSVPVSLLL